MKTLWLLVGGLCACATPLKALQTERTALVGSVQFVIRSDGTTGADVAIIERSLQAAVEPLQQWGGLQQQVTVHVVSSHADLETAVGAHGYDWLRGWALFDELIVQSPSTWTTQQQVVNQFILHELTHCVMFQQSADRAAWAQKKIPLWFREGMAIDTARQHSLYPSLEDTAQWSSQHQVLDVFHAADRLSARHSSQVYGFALHAFRFFDRRYGTATVRKLMQAMREGANFAQAFHQTTGIQPMHFETDFLRYLRLRAFRGENRQRRTNGM